MQEIWNEHSGDLTMAGNSASVSCDFLFFPRSKTCAGYIESKTNRGPSRERPLSRAPLRPQLFCEFYLQPVYRAASTRFQRSYFLSTFPTAIISNALPFSRLCEPASSDATCLRVSHCPLNLPPSEQRFSLLLPIRFDIAESGSPQPTELFCQGNKNQVQIEKTAARL
jgi:hypothetical protein